MNSPASQAHAASGRASGPLTGTRIVEFAGIGPGPFACMMLADMGAEVVTLDRVGARKNLKSVAGRGRKVVEVDLKDKAASAQVLDLLGHADALIEGFRPGVMERLGLGPDVVMARNPRLVFGRWTDARESNFLDGGAHFYGVYQCACGNFISIGSIEPQFYALLRQHAGLSDAEFDAQMDRKAWPSLRQRLVDVFKTKTRKEWCKIMEGSDVCFAPVLTMSVAPEHPHMAARKIFVSRHGVTQPAPAPRFSRTPSSILEAVTADVASPTSEWRGGRELLPPALPGARSPSPETITT